MEPHGDIRPHIPRVLSPFHIADIHVMGCPGHIHCISPVQKLCLKLQSHRQRQLILRHACGGATGSACHSGLRGRCSRSDGLRRIVPVSLMSRINDYHPSGAARRPGYRWQRGCLGRRLRCRRLLLRNIRSADKTAPVPIGHIVPLLRKSAACQLLSAAYHSNHTTVRSGSLTEIDPGCGPHGLILPGKSIQGIRRLCRSQGGIRILPAVSGIFVVPGIFAGCSGIIRLLLFRDRIRRSAAPLLQVRDTGQSQHDHNDRHNGDDQSLPLGFIHVTPSLIQIHISLPVS